MSIAIEKYLDRAMIFANRNEGEARDVRVELEDHLYKKVAELEAKDVPRSGVWCYAEMTCAAAGQLLTRPPHPGSFPDNDDRSQGACF